MGKELKFGKTCVLGYLVLLSYCLVLANLKLNVIRFVLRVPDLILSGENRSVYSRRAAVQAPGNTESSRII